MDDTDDTSLKLDGNAAAGLLREIFAHDMTRARVSCASCGHLAQIGSTPLYMAALSPGGVLRCERCEDVLMVVVDLGDRWRLGTPGLKWLEIGGPRA